MTGQRGWAPTIRRVDEVRQTREAYDVVAADYAELSADLTAVEHAVDRGLVAAFAELSRGGLVGDLGCGPGRMAAHLQELGVEVVGLDLSAGMLAQARRRHPGLTVLQGSITKLPFGDATLAGALGWYSIIHVPPNDLPLVCRELGRVVAPGGHLLVAFHAGTGERVERDEVYGHRVPLTGYRHDPAYVERLLQQAGCPVLSRTTRAPVAHERVPQAFLLARAG